MLCRKNAIILFIRFYSRGQRLRCGITMKISYLRWAIEKGQLDSRFASLYGADAVEWQRRRYIRALDRFAINFGDGRFYIDGVYTIIDMATAYGTSLGLNTTGLLLALLLTQIVAFPASLTFAVLSKTKNTASLIKVAIIAYFLIALFAVQLDKQWEFWVLAVAVGCFQGGIQALSRSYFAKIIPENASGEYFGLFDICGKGASFLGTMLIGVVTQITGKQNLGVAALSIMFVVGYLIFNKVSKIDD